MRLVILGGLGWFGRATADLLRRRGERPLIASRGRGADLLVDAENARSLSSALRPHDIIIDAAGPFQRRSTRLIETCVTLGCDVIDLSDSLQYTMRVQSLASDISAAGIRVLNACSSVAAVSTALIRETGISRPVRVSVFLAPATANTSTGATARSLVASLGGTIQVRRGGHLIEMQPFADERLFSFPPPVGVVHGRRAESADALLLPQVWPSLQDVDFWVDTRRRALNSLFAVAARHRLLSSGVETPPPDWPQAHEDFRRPIGVATPWWSRTAEAAVLRAEWLTLRTAIWSPLRPRCSRLKALPPAVCPSVAYCRPINTSIRKN